MYADQQLSKYSLWRKKRWYNLNAFLHRQQRSLLCPFTVWRNTRDRQQKPYSSVTNSIRCNNFPARQYMENTHPTIALAVHFHNFPAFSIHLLRTVPCAMTPFRCCYICQQVGKIQRAAWSAPPHLETKKMSRTYLPSVVPVRQSPKVARELRFPTEQCKTQITRWLYYVAVITKEIPALHKPGLSCSVTLHDYLNKNAPFPMETAPRSLHLAGDKRNNLEMLLTSGKMRERLSWGEKCGWWQQLIVQCRIHHGYQQTLPSGNSCRAFSSPKPVVGLLRTDHLYNSNTDILH